MISLFIKGRKHRTKASAVYDETTGIVTVLKGSIVSEQISDFQSSDHIRKLRSEKTDSVGMVLEDIPFKNSTAAAQFVCGYSASGLVAWHVEKHKTLSEWIKENS